ncbi:hypothetical protein, partial [Escherichia coli]|uniref:hypothetical protein n=1 Tax=Escherichia coli TaxID=562 RepID=UPI003BA1E960
MLQVSLFKKQAYRTIILYIQTDPKNALRSGDIWVKGSRQFRDFDDYLLPAEKFAALKREQALPLA